MIEKYIFNPAICGNVVDKDKSRISRRKALQMSGVGMVAFTGKSTAGKAEAKRENKETRARLKPSVHRVSKRSKIYPSSQMMAKLDLRKGA
jgi:hypothetical protein